MAPASDSDELLHVLEGLGQAGLRFDAEGRVTACGALWAERYGAAEGAVGAPVDRRVGPAEVVSQALAALARGEARVADATVAVGPTDGASSPGLAAATFIGLPSGGGVVALRPLFAGAGAFTLETLDRLLELSHDAIAVTRADQRTVAVNPAACALSGYSRAELLGRTTREVGLFADVPARDALIAELQTHGVVRDVPLPLRRKNGEHRDVVLSAQFIEVAGETLGMFVATDVTELEEARHGWAVADAFAIERDTLLQAVFQTSPAIITVTNAEDGRYVAVNAAFEARTGLSAADALGRTGYELGFVSSRDEELAILEALRAEGRKEATLVRRNAAGEEKHLLSSAVCVELGGEPRVVAVTIDTTAHHRLEEQKQHSWRLEAIGQLAGGVAHDFNNVLTAIISSAELLASRSDGDAELTKLVLEAAHRGADLTRQLLAFSRKRKIVATTFDAHEPIRSTAALLRRTIDPKVAVALHLDATRAHVHGDASILGSALLNLGLNARDAMPGGGRLTIATRDVELAPEDCEGTLLPVTPGPHVELRVSDTGQGMPPEVLRRAFEPFFTTKDVGRGTGLGLAVVHGAVADHGGTIAVTSAPGVGTTFRLLLPTIPAPAHVVPVTAPAASPRRGRVLLVEDNPTVAATATALLRALGAETSHAADGLEALQRVASAESFDLVLLDLVMPRMGGREALTEIRRLRPSLPIVLMSGYNEDADLDVLLARGEVAAFLPKPFRLTDMREMLARVLGDAPAG